MNERLLLFIVEPPDIVELEERKEGERERKKKRKYKGGKKRMERGCWLT